MKKGIPPLVIGNWKMFPQTATLAVKLAKNLKSALVRTRDVDIVVAPPSVYLDAVHAVQHGARGFTLGAQNVHHEKLGAHTGEVSVSMLKSFDVTHVIVGHSERRAAGETDAQVHAKLIAVLKAGLTPVLCVGEKKRDEAGQYFSLIESQMRTALADVARTKLERVVIAYEPVWAIGTGNTATAADVHVMRLFIEKVLTDIYGRNYAQKVRILYGGSVSEKSARELFVDGNVDGFLVGGASLDVEAFAQIVKQTQIPV